jgi:hypothetical protein
LPGLSDLTEGLGFILEEQNMIDERTSEEAEHFFEWNGERTNYVTFTSCLLFAEHMIEKERKRCISIIEAYRVPVGNSAAGEMACEWTMDALREVRDAINET